MNYTKALLATALLLLLAGCGGPEPDSAQSVLNRGMAAEPESLDPQKARSTQAGSVLRDAGEGLMRYSANGDLVGAAAADWQLSDDGLEYTFTLRENLKWSDGEPLTAEHFVHGIRRLVDPATGAFYAQAAEVIANAPQILAGDADPETLGVEAVDDRTVVIRLERQVPYFLNLLTQPGMYPARPDQDTVDGRPLVQNGPYIVERWEPGSYIRLARNDEYWNADNVSIDVVTWHVTADEVAEYNRYRTGELDITTTVPSSLFSDVKAEFGDQLHIANYLGVYYYGFNLTRPPLAGNPELRQALSMAIDRERLVEQITGRGEKPAYSWVPPGVSNYEPRQLSFAGMTREQREDSARRLLASAGYGPDNPLEIELLYNTSDAHRRIAIAVQAMWQEVLGVEATLVNQEFQVMLANIRERATTEVFRSSWIGDYNDAQTFLGIMVGGHSSNLPAYANDEYDDLIRRAATQTDLDARRLYLEEAERVLLSDHAVIPLYFYVSKHLVKPRVSGWQDNVLDYHYSQDLSLGATDPGQ